VENYRIERDISVLSDQALDGFLAGGPGNSGDKFISSSNELT
jgi:hypothetical protein